MVRDTQGFDLSILYYSCKANVVVDYLRSLFMDCTIHFEEGKNELAQEVHRLAQLGVWLMEFTEGEMVVTDGFESSLVWEIKGDKDQDPILLELK